MKYFYIFVILICISCNLQASTKNKSLLRISAANSVVGTDIVNELAIQFKAKYPDVELKISSGGARTVLEHGRQGKADLIITHYPPDEERFMAKEFGTVDTQIMYNEYIILGPADDPENISLEKDIVDVIRLMEKNAVDFTAPSLKSGIYRKWDELLTLSGVLPNWPGYLQSEVSGKRTLLNAASNETYVMADMGTYIVEREKIKKKIIPLFRDASVLRNYISAIIVNPNKVSGVNYDIAYKFYEFLISDEVQNFLGAYGKDKYSVYIYTPAAFLDPHLRAKRSETLLQLSSDRNKLIIVSAALMFGFFIVLAIVSVWLRRKEDARLKALYDNKTKSAFLANMSHELRTPLNAIIGYSELLIEVGKDNSILSDLRKIHNSGKHLLRIINDILDLSKIEEGKIDLYYENIELNSFLKDISLIVKPLMDKSGNILNIEISHGIHHVYVDETRLKQVLLNIISNAAKFTKDGTIVLTVKRETNNNHNIIFTIIDDGIGMDEEQLSKIFSAYEQATSSTTKIFGGTGLGLTITKQLCELMNGTINVESKVGKGTRFSIKLPILK